LEDVARRLGEAKTLGFSINWIQKSPIKNDGAVFMLKLEKAFNII